MAQMFNVHNIVFACMVIVALLLLVIAEATDYWFVEDHSFEQISQGLWRICYYFARTKTMLCVTPGAVSVAVHLARASFLLSTAGFALSLILVYLVEKRFIQSYRVPALVSFFPFFCGLIGMAAFTVEIYKHADTKTIRFAWSYYLGWTAFVIALAAIVYGIKDVPRVAGEPN